MKKFFVLGIVLILSLSFFGCSDGGGGGDDGTSTATLKIINNASTTPLKYFRVEEYEWNLGPKVRDLDYRWESWDSINIPPGGEQDFTIRVSTNVNTCIWIDSTYENTWINSPSEGFAGKTLIFTYTNLSPTLTIAP